MGSPPGDSLRCREALAELCEESSRQSPEHAPALTPTTVPESPADGDRPAKRARIQTMGRDAAGITRVLHDLASDLHRANSLIDGSQEVQLVAQRMMDAVGDVTRPAHYGGALMLAIKLVSTQYSLAPVSWVAAYLGVSPRDVLAAELHLCTAAGWRLMPFCST